MLAELQETLPLCVQRPCTWALGVGVGVGDVKRRGILLAMPLRIGVGIIVVGVLTTRLNAQVYTRPGLQWETAKTAHFVMHYPREMRTWALDVAGRLEREREAVVALVGYAPPRRVTVIVENPFDAPNGFALPFMDAPTVFLWPTPPGPADDIGTYRIWGELVSTHEFAHIAHLTRPSRNPWQRTLSRLLMVELSPIARRAPRWVYEGYATYVEGKITGAGRPNSTARATVLREFALEGKLPSYAQLDGSVSYEGGAMAYLAGSAFLEWLVARSGEESLPHLWRRMTARVDRTFVDAFAGVFGGPPDELYGRFATELTGKALQAQQDLVTSSLDTGTTFQRLAWYTGAPALSPDGTLLAIPLRSELEPTRIVIWKTAPAPEDSAAAHVRERLLARDPEDVPAIPYAPPTKQPVATLLASNGRAYDAPRFLPDGRHVLVVRAEPLLDGALRRDLFVWDSKSGHVRRITHGAAIESADPAPDGRTAVGIQCHAGLCDLITIDLDRGTVRVLAPASPARRYYRPRVAPDGRSAIVSVHDTAGTIGRWRLAVLPIADNARTHSVGPEDDANRYQAAFVGDGHSVVTVSDAGGIPHLEVIDLATNTARTAAAGTGGLIAPEPSHADSSVYFLSVWSKGLTLNRVTLPAPLATSPQLRADLTPAAPAPSHEPAPELQASTPAAPPSPTSYGLGPRGFRVLPGGAIATDGRYATLAVVTTDPVGRLGATLQGILGDPGAWRGVALAATWRGLPEFAGRATIDGTAFTAEQHPSHEAAGSFATLAFPRGALDANYHGITLSLDNARALTWGADALRLGGSVGSIALADRPPGARSLAFLEYDADDRYGRGDAYLDATIRLDGTVGHTGTGWRRGRAALSLGVGTRNMGLRGNLTLGTVNRGAPPYEQFVAGGGDAPLTDSALLSQRLVAPALPLGIAGGRQLLDTRVATDGPGPILYYEALSAGATFHSWHRLVGVDWRGTIPSIPFLRLPSIFLNAGAGYSLTAPFRHKLRGYVGVRYAP